VCFKEFFYYTLSDELNVFEVKLNKIRTIFSTTRMQMLRHVTDQWAEVSGHNNNMRSRIAAGLRIILGLFHRFRSAIPKGRYSEMRINYGSGGGELNLMLVRCFGIAALRNSGLIPFHRQ